jgi:SAM-dependent methyltransferase
MSEQQRWKDAAMSGDDANERPLGSGGIDYDAELQRHQRVLVRACGVQSGDHVLDIGCGTGHTTRQAAGAAQPGRALGVDISAPAIERAREMARADGVHNVAFECADAQAHRFPPARFDLAMSRFGTMFFDDPAAAFINIRRALRPGGRLTMMVWQAADRNEWDVALREALAGPRAPVPADPAGPGPFSLGERPTVTEILGTAGFVDVAFAEVGEPVYYGPDVETALRWVRGFTSTSRALDGLDAADTEGALGRLLAVLAAHLGDDGVWFDSRAWIVTARRR